VPVGQTLASEFGGLNVSTNRLHGTCHNPWQHGRTAGGSSGGSSSAVAGGLVSIATGGDGGGSIRIPAGFCGLVGMKGTAGRIPRGPHTLIAPMTVVVGCQARSVRDVARWYDVASGYDMRDPYSLPRIDGWERDLGSFDLRGKRVAIAPTLGAAVVRDEVQARVIAAGEALARDAGLVLVDLDVKLPKIDVEWALGNLAGLYEDLRGLWPECKDLLTPSTAFGMEFAEHVVNLDTVAKGEASRTAANEAMAAIFDEVDFVICATNPDTAFPAEVLVNTRVGEREGGGRQQRRAHHPGQHHRQPVDLGAGGTARRPAGGDADHGAPPRGPTPARPCGHRGAHHAVAAGGARRPALNPR
jgi:Asp-tRNA(Asn)/Glu-tRNA(Gln) amidotransferase A subunit family amidase